jgi:hypothetical protein
MSLVSLVKRFVCWWRFAAQRLALVALGRGGETPSERKMLRRRKLPEKRAESHQSGARRVSPLFFFLNVYHL